MELPDLALVGRRARVEIVGKSSNKYGREEKMRKKEKRGEERRGDYLHRRTECA